MSTTEQMLNGVEAARWLAVAAHRGQKYGPETEYAEHLRVVAHIVARYTDDEATICAAWLHDVVEDTPVTLALVDRLFGPDVAAIVDAVTDEPGETRADRKAATLPKTRRDSRAVLVKLADRLANAEAAFAVNFGLWRMYEKEHADFRAALYREGEHAALWEQLDSILA